MYKLIKGALQTLLIVDSSGKEIGGVENDLGALYEMQDIDNDSVTLFPSDCIAFAEWIALDLWTYIRNKDIWIRNGAKKTTEQLFQIWNNQRLFRLIQEGEVVIEEETDMSDYDIDQAINYSGDIIYKPKLTSGRVKIIRFV